MRISARERQDDFAAPEDLSAALNLLADADEGLNEGGAELSAEQARSLQLGAKCEYLAGIDMLQGEPDQRHQCQSLSDGLDDLRGKKIISHPFAGKPSGHEAGAADERKA